MKDIGKEIIKVIEYPTYLGIYHLWIQSRKQFYIQIWHQVRVQVWHKIRDEIYKTFKKEGIEN